MTGSTSTSSAKPRERLLDAAERLFVRDGVNAVGVDRLADEAKVSKRSLYQHFGTKDAMVAAMLDTIGPRIATALVGDESDDRTPRQRILGVFDAQQRSAESPAYFGCPFVNIATEMRDRDHVGSKAARAHKLELTSFFEREAVALGIADPAELAVQLTMMFDGAGAYAAMHGAGIPPAARRAVELLIDASPRAAG